MIQGPGRHAASQQASAERSATTSGSAIARVHPRLEPAEVFGYASEAVSIEPQQIGFQESARNHPRPVFRHPLCTEQGGCVVDQIRFPESRQAG